MMKKRLVEVIAIILILSCLSGTVYGLTSVVEANPEKDVIISTNTDKENPLKDAETLKIEQKVEQELNKQYNEVSNKIEEYIVNNFTSKKKQIENEIDKYFPNIDTTKAKEYTFEEVLSNFDEKWTKQKKAYWETYKDGIKERITNESKKKDSEFIGVSSKIIVQYMFDPIYNKISDSINDSVPLVGSVCANLANRYIQSLNIDVLLANEIRKSVGLEVVKYKIDDFDWGPEVINAGFAAIGSEASGYVEELFREATQKLFDKLGINSNATDLDEALTDWMGIQIEATVNQWVKNATDYVLGRNELDEARKRETEKAIKEFGGELTDEMKKDVEKKAKASVEKMKSDAANRLAELKKEALGRVAESIGDFAGDYVNSMYQNLEDEMVKFGRNFGKFGTAVIRGFSNQIQSWLTGNITNNVTNYLKNCFLNENNKVEWTKFEIDWTRLGANVLLSLLADESLADKLDLVYGAISSVGGIVTGPLLYEAYANVYFMFILARPSSTPAEEASTASAVASAITDEGNLGVASDIYDPTQFNALADNLLITKVGPRTAETFASAFAISHGSPRPIIGEPSARTVPWFVPTGTFLCIPGDPTYADSGYILCFMKQNTSKSSFVQIAFSTSTYGRLFGRPPAPTLWSALLNVEAWGFQAFTLEVSSKGGYKNSLKDETNVAVSRYHEEAGMFVIGPFKVEYVRGYMLAGLYGKADFGMMVDMQVCDQNGEKIPQNSWVIMYSESEDVEQSTKHKTRLLDKGYNYPYPGEEFYIGISQYSNQEVTSISEIKMKFKEMQVMARGVTMGIQYAAVGYKPYSIVIGVTTSGTPIFYNSLAAIPKPIINPRHSLCVTIATKYYLDYNFSIYLHENKSDTAKAAYDTREYTTTSSSSISGVEFITISPAVAGNSAMTRTVDRLISRLETASPYSATGVPFLDNLSKAYNVYSSLGYNPTVLQGAAVLLEVFGKNDLARAITAADALFSKDGNTFSKTMKVASVFVKDEKIRKLMYGIGDVVEMFGSKKTDSEKGMRLLRMAAEISGNKDVKIVTDAVGTAIQSTPYKDAVWNAICQGNLSRSELDEYLKTKYPGYSANQRQEIIDEVKNIDSLIRNSGVVGNRVADIFQGCYSAANRTDTITNIAGTIGESFGIKNAKTVATAYERITQTSKQKEVIMRDESLDDLQKAELVKAEDAKIWQIGINTVQEFAKDNAVVQSLDELYEAHENYEKIQKTNKEIEKIKGNTSLTEEQKKEQIEQKNKEITDLGIDTARTIGIIGSDEYKAATTAIDNYDKIKETTKKIEEIKTDNNLTEKQKETQIKALEDQLIEYGINNVNITNKSNSEIFDIGVKAYKTYSTLEATTTKEFFNTIKDMNKTEITQLINTIEKSNSTEDALTIIENVNARKALETSEQKEVRNRQFYIDEIDKLNGAQLYDSSAYTEFDSNYNVNSFDRPSKVYYMGDDEIDLTMTIAGEVWKDGHTGFQNDYDGIRTANANGDLEAGVEGVKVTLIRERGDKVTRNRNGQKVQDVIGRMRVNEEWVDAITYTDEGGYYHLEEVESGKYYVEFEYDGEKYMATTYLSDGEKEGDIWNYELFPDQEKYFNNSKVAEDLNERLSFNDKFYQIINGTAVGRNGGTIELEYEAKDGVSSLVTTDNYGHVLPRFAMHASSQTVGITYPIDTTVTLENEGTSMLVSTKEQDVPVSYDYRKTGEYMYHVNLGLIERSKIDLAVTQDVYNVTTTVNEKQQDYIYNGRGNLSIFDANLKHTDAYRNISYTRELYNADYQLRLEDYKLNDLNKLDKNGEDNREKIERVQEIKELEHDRNGLEERVFVTYKMTLVNQTVLQSATINELTDYFDPTYKLVEEDTYQQIQNEHGEVERKLVAKQSFFIVKDAENAVEYKLNWEQTGMANGFNTMRTVQTSGDGVGLEDVMIRAGDEVYVFVTFEVDTDNNDALQLGKKQNIVEISNYSSFEIGSTNKDHSIGLIDRDSEPDNISVGYYTDYEDDTDAAPILDLKLYSTDLRTINGYVWNDNRTVTLSTGQVVGNGIREEAEEKLNGVKVQLIEIVRDPLNGEEFEYVWKEMYTGEDAYSYVGSSGNLMNPVRGQAVTTGSVTTDTNLGATQRGEYKFHDYIAGNFIVRFIYGDTYKTYLASGTENGQGEGRNEASFNGQDYKSTAYQKGNNLNAIWFDLRNAYPDSKLYSDAKDNSDRRKEVIKYSSTIKNKEAEVLASADGRKDKNYYNRLLHQDLRDKTWMFADTAKLNVNIEYDRTNSNGIEGTSYYVRNIDFGLEERPETKLEIKKEITDITVTLASGETIINTAAGMSKNVNWVSNARNEEKGHDYKRDNFKYTYRQGKIHIYMDKEIQQGATIKVTYRITVTNKSEVDYTGQNGELGYVYYTGETYSGDKIVTTKVDKIIDYVDNSLTFRKDDNPDWSLIETMSDFNARLDEQDEEQRMDMGEFIDFINDQLGDNYSAKHYREVQAAFQVYQQTGKITGIGGLTEEVNQEEMGAYLTNYNVLQSMKDNGYLHEDLSIVRTKSAKTTQVPISQVIVTKALENKELRPGQSASVELVLSKTLSPQDESDDLTYSNLTEILQYSNTVGRRDMDAVPGNQEPDAEPNESDFERDTDFTEQIIITPPTGENRSFYYVISAVVLVVLSGGIFLIKKKVLDK